MAAFAEASASPAVALAKAGLFMFPHGLAALAEGAHAFFGVLGGDELVEIDLFDVSEPFVEGQAHNVRDGTSREAEYRCRERLEELDPFFHFRVELVRSDCAGNEADAF